MLHRQQKQTLFFGDNGIRLYFLDDTAASNLKRCLPGLHHGVVPPPKHLQAYLAAFCFRQNRRNTNGVVRLAARCLEGMITKPPLTKTQLVKTPQCRNFRGASSKPEKSREV